MSQSTALATSTGTRALARFGSEADIQMLMERQASIFGIERSEVDRPDVQAALVKATQYSITYGYLPGIHIHMIPFRKKVKVGNREEWINTYQPAVGEKAYKDSADRIAQMQGFRYLVETQEMTAAEVQAATTADKTAVYTPGDAGFKARVLRSDHAEIYRMMGRQYEPEWSYGFWRQKAKKKSSGEWISDETPSQRGPRDVAERRAYKAALMKVFTLVPLNEFEDSRRFQNLSHHVEMETAVDMTLMAPPPALHYDEDGLLLHGEAPASEGHYRAIDADTGEIYGEAPEAHVDYGLPEGEPRDSDYDPDADFDSIPGQGASVSGAYAKLIGNLTGPSLKFAEWARKSHSESDGPATQPQYRYLGAVINQITGQDGSHYALLELLTGRPTNSDNPPGYDLASKLLDWLPEEKTEKGEGGKKIKLPNPDYQKKYVDALLVIWRVIQESNGQQSLPLE